MTDHIASATYTSAVENLRLFVERRPSYPDDAVMMHADHADMIRMGHLRELVRLLSAVTDADVAKMRSALEKIERWFGEFPATGKTWDDGSTMSYSACYGSNGERDYMRGIAKDALRVSPQATGKRHPDCVYPEECKKLGKCIRPDDHDSPPACGSNPPSSTAAIIGWLHESADEALKRGDLKTRGDCLAGVAEIERLLRPTSAKHCQNGVADTCLAAQSDGIVCPDDSCDIDDGTRKSPLSTVATGAMNIAREVVAEADKAASRGLVHPPVEHWKAAKMAHALVSLPSATAGVKELADWDQLFQAATMGHDENLRKLANIPALWPNPWHQDCAMVAFLIHGLQERFKWLEETLKHCPHAELKFNDDPDDGEYKGWTLKIESCGTLSLEAPTLAELIDIGMKAVADEDGNVVASAADSTSRKS